MTENAEPNDAAFLEKMIHKLILYNKPKPGEAPEAMTLEEVLYLIERVVIDLKDKPGLLECDPPLTVCGDTHGQYNDLLRLLKHSGWPPNTRYLFLGDYVDRGKNSIEVICLMFAFKCRYPNGFFLLRGNHETAVINRVYGFYEECKNRYNIHLWSKFQEAFNSLPIAGLISGRIFCMHGGLSPELHSFDQIRRMTLPFEAPETGCLIADLLWSDPAEGIQGYIPSNRGIAYIFGEDAVYQFCSTHRIDLIARAHQVIDDGYKFFANRKLVTVFSAPNYCGEFNNLAGMITISANMQVKLRTLKPARRRQPKTSPDQQDSLSRPTS